MLVCLPACCQGCPCETSRCTLLGCGQVRYDYACGCSVIIRFQKHGDILVTYVGFSSSVATERALFPEKVDHPAGRLLPAGFLFDMVRG